MGKINIIFLEGSKLIKKSLVIIVLLLLCSSFLYFFLWLLRGKVVSNTSVEITDGVIIQFVRIPAGSFAMGKTAEYAIPFHDVTFTQDLYMGVHEITQLQYYTLIASNPSYHNSQTPFIPLPAEWSEVKDYLAEKVQNIKPWGPKLAPSKLTWQDLGYFLKMLILRPEIGRGSPNSPVENVSWFDAAIFCNLLSEKYKLQKCYVISNGSATIDYFANGFRLPTEAEWEYACRAGTTTDYYWGSELNGAYAWYDGNSDNNIHDVGQKKPNPWGLYDMSGNVFEWCNDFFHYRPPCQTVDPIGPATPYTSGHFKDSRVMRGGSFFVLSNVATYNVALTSFFRSGWVQSSGTSSHGFRICHRKFD